MDTIAIDCGASFIKGALLKDGTVIRQLQRKAPSVSADDDLFNPSQVELLVRGVREMILELAAGEEEVKLCVSNEMHGFLLAFRDGACYTDYISWQKEYGAVAVDGVSSMELLGRDELRERVRNTGMPLRAGLPSCNLLYLARKNYLGEDSGKLHFYTLGDYVLRALAGAEVMCHPTNAAATGLYDIVAGEWDAELIEAAGAREIVFPAVWKGDNGNSSTESGNDTIRFELDGVTIHAYPALGDQQAALLGAGLSDESSLSFNLGTGAQVSRLTDRPVFSPDYQIRPFFGGNYLMTLPHIPSGRALNVYLRFMRSIFEEFNLDVSEEEIWEHLVSCAVSDNEAGLDVDMSFFANPLRPNTNGSIGNISEYSLTLGNLMGAVFDQMGQNFLQAADRIGAVPEQVERIIFSGGVARRIEAVRKAILERYSPKVEVVVAENETLLGLYRYGNR